MSNKSTLMNIGPLSSRPDALATLMKRVPPSFLFGALLATAGLTSAEPPAGKQDAGRPRQDQSADADRGRSDEGRIRTPEEGERKHHARLSPEERRALRQHINEAGQDLYPAKKGK